MGALALWTGGRLGAFIPRCSLHAALSSSAMRDGCHDCQTAVALVQLVSGPEGLRMHLEFWIIDSRSRLIRSMMRRSWVIHTQDSSGEVRLHRGPAEIQHSWTAQLVSHERRAVRSTSSVWQSTANHRLRTAPRCTHGERVGYLYVPGDASRVAEGAWRDVDGLLACFESGSTV